MRSLGELIPSFFLQLDVNDDGEDDLLGVIL